MRLDETIALQLPSGSTVPLIPRGTALPTSLEQTLSTARDDQPSVRAEVVTQGGERAHAVLEVEVWPAPRGVPQVRLAIRVDDRGAVRIELWSGHASANASFEARIAP
jgi:molecular chaperone DnaK